MRVHLADMYISFANNLSVSSKVLTKSEKYVAKSIQCCW